MSFSKKIIETSLFPVHVKLSVISLCLGLVIINLAFLDSTIRQAFAFTCFGFTIFFSLKENFKDIFQRKGFKYYFIIILLILYICIYHYTIGSYQEYGNNKFYYLLFVLVLSFISSSPLLKYKKARDFFSTLLFYSSLFFCFSAIFFADPSLGRRGEIGLNPAILARLCMISGIYISCVIYIKGFTFLRGIILVISIVSVFFTATKTPVPVYIFSFFIVIAKDLSIKEKIKISFYLVLLLIIGFFILQYFVPDEFASRILDQDAFSEQNQLKEGNRFDLYVLAIDVISSNPIGTGLGGFAKFHRFIVVPHNILLEIAVELGLFLMSIFILWSFSVFKKIRRFKKNTVSSLFISVLFTYLFISFLFGGEVTIQLVLLYIIGGYFSFFNNKTRYETK